MVPTRPKLDPSLRISETDGQQLPQIKDILTHDWPLLLILGVDSHALAAHLYERFSAASKKPLKRERPADLTAISTFLLRPEVQAFNGIHLLDLYDSSAAEIEISRSFLFRRDLIASKQLGLVVVGSHQLLNLFVGEAHDFYAMATFSGVFHDALAPLDRAWDHFWSLLAEQQTAPTAAVPGADRRYSLGRRARQNGQLKEARLLLEGALGDLAPEDRLHAYTQIELGYLDLVEGGLAQAEVQFQRARERLTQKGDTDGILWALKGLTQTYLLHGRFDQAEQMVLAGATLSTDESLDDHNIEFQALRATVAFNRQNLQDARAFAQRVLDFPSGGPNSYGAKSAAQRIIAWLETDDAHRRSRIGRAVEQAMLSNQPHQLVRCLQDYGEMLAEGGRFELGATYLFHAALCHAGRNNRAELGPTLARWTACHLQGGTTGEALTLIDETVASAESNRALINPLLLQKAKLLRARGALDEAEQILDQLQRS